MACKNVCYHDWFATLKDKIEVIIINHDRFLTNTIFQAYLIKQLKLGAVPNFGYTYFEYVPNY